MPHLPGQGSGGRAGREGGAGRASVPRPLPCTSSSPLRLLRALVHPWVPSNHSSLSSLFPPPLTLVPPDPYTRPSQASFSGSRILGASWRNHHPQWESRQSARLGWEYPGWNPTFLSRQTDAGRDPALSGAWFSPLWTTVEQARAFPYLSLYPGLLI